MKHIFRATIFIVVLHLPCFAPTVQKAHNKLGFTFGRCFRFEICKLRHTPSKQGYKGDGVEEGGGGEGGWEGGREGWRKNTHRHAAGGGGGRVGTGVFFLKTSLAPRLAVVRLREEWKNNILPFRPEFSTLSVSLSLSLSLLLSFFLFIIA
jgi:hypothetical protein